MTQLKSLTFAALPRLSAADPVIHRRNKLIVRLQQQIALVQDPQFALTRQKWIASPPRPPGANSHGNCCHTGNPRCDPAAIIEAGKTAMRERFEAMR
jgi:hypothetical protein